MAAARRGVSPRSDRCPPTRVLEVGCGEGDLAIALDRAVEWASEEGLHSSGQMLEEIGRRLAQRSFSWWPYLYPDLDDTSEADELAAIEAGEINATSFCYVGAVASERSVSAH